MPFTNPSRAVCLHQPISAPLTSLPIYSSQESGAAKAAKTQAEEQIHRVDCYSRPGLTCWAWEIRRKSRVCGWSIHRRLCWWSLSFSPGGAKSPMTGASPLWAAACPGKAAACGWRSRWRGKVKRNKVTVKTILCSSSSCCFIGLWKYLSLMTTLGANCTLHFQSIACWLTQTSQIHCFSWY